jgi:hypothetical protein
VAAAVDGVASETSILLYRGFDEPSSVKFDGKFTKEAIVQFIEKHGLPPLASLDQ